MKKVYFLCMGNSCRSQMAEGYDHKFLKDCEVRSDGIESHGVNSRAVQVMDGRG